MLFEEMENLIVLLYVFCMSFAGVLQGFRRRSFKGLFIIKSLVSAQPIKGLFSGVLVRGLDKVLNTLINNEYNRIAGDRVASPMSRMTGQQRSMSWSEVLVRGPGQRSWSEVLVRGPG